MQKFENGESVEVWHGDTMDDQEWTRADYIGIAEDGKGHICGVDSYKYYEDCYVQSLQPKEGYSELEHKKAIANLLEQINVKDAEIERLRCVKCELDRVVDVKDSEIDRLELMVENVENRIDKLSKQNESLHAIRNIVYEIVNAPTGHKFEMIQKDGCNIDVTVR